MTKANTVWCGDDGFEVTIEWWTGPKLPTYHYYSSLYPLRINFLPLLF